MLIESCWFLVLVEVETEKKLGAQLVATQTYLSTNPLAIPRRAQVVVRLNMSKLPMRDDPSLLSQEEEGRVPMNGVQGRRARIEEHQNLHCRGLCEIAGDVRRPYARLNRFDRHHLQGFTKMFRLSNKAENSPYVSKIHSKSIVVRKLAIFFQKRRS